MAMMKKIRSSLIYRQLVCHLLNLRSVIARSTIQKLLLKMCAATCVNSNTNFLPQSWDIRSNCVAEKSKSYTRNNRGVGARSVTVSTLLFQNSGSPTRDLEFEQKTGLKSVLKLIQDRKHGFSKLAVRLAEILYKKFDRQN